MPLFFHDTVLPKDPDGFSVWQIEHYYEHLQFCQLGLRQATPIFIPDYDISVLAVGAASQRAQWLSAHAQIHEALRDWVKTDGIDLANVDLDDDQQWFQWMDAHAVEHRALRAALNVT